MECMLLSSIKFTIFFFLILVCSDVIWEVAVLLFSGSAETVFPRVAAYVSGEMHWASKVVVAFFAGFFMGYLVPSRDVHGRDI